MAYPFTVTAEYRQDRSVFVTLAVPPGDPSAAWAASVEPKPDGSGWIVRPSAARPRPCADRLTAVLLAVSLAEKEGERRAADGIVAGRGITTPRRT
jgi:hypothetical protein